MSELFGDPIDTGSWGQGTSWELFLTQILPTDAPYTTAASVAITFSHGRLPRVVLVQNVSEGDESRRGKGGMPGGHIDPLADRLESPRETVVREGREEAGLPPPLAMGLFACRVVHNALESGYPIKAYSPFFWMIIRGKSLLTPTDEPPPVGIFTPLGLKELAAEWSYSTLGVFNSPARYGRRYPMAEANRQVSPMKNTRMRSVNRPYPSQYLLAKGEQLVRPIRRNYNGYVNVILIKREGNNEIK